MTRRVREAFLADAPALALVGAATFLESYAGILDGASIVSHCQRHHDVASYERFMGSGAHAWIAEAAEGHAPVGYALLTTPDIPGGDAAAGDLELKRIYSLSRFHGGGLGAALMQRAVERAVREGARRLVLGVYSRNERALAFYRRQGFAQIGERLFTVGTRDYEDFVLARPLS